MAARFATARTSAAPVFTTLPFTAGGWARTLTIAAGSSALFSWWAALDVDTYEVYRSGPTLRVWGGTTSTDVLTLVAGRWFYFILRGITTSNKRLSAVDSLGTIGNGQSTDTASITPLAYSVGAEGDDSQPWNGDVAELWMTDTDIQPGGGVLDTTTLLYIAYNGPMAVPYIANNLVFYRSFRSTTDGVRENAEDVYQGKYGKLTWTASTGITTSDHPPLMYQRALSRTHMEMPPFAKTASLILPRSQVCIFQ